MATLGLHGLVPAVGSSDLLQALVELRKGGLLEVAHASGQKCGVVGCLRGMVVLHFIANIYWGERSDNLDRIIDMVAYFAKPTAYCLGCWGWEAVFGVKGGLWGDKLM